MFYVVFLELDFVVFPVHCSLVFTNNVRTDSVDENGKDQGVNVRQRVKELVEFIQDDERLREERKKAKKNKDKYVGVSSDSMGYRSYCKSPLCEQYEWSHGKSAGF